MLHCIQRIHAFSFMDEGRTVFIPKNFVTYSVLTPFTAQICEICVVKASAV